jgi:hypothetical protein
MVTVTVPVANAEARTRIADSPAMLTAQEPGAVALVTAAPPANGVTESEEKLVPSPVPSNCSVPVKLPEIVTDAPPKFGAEFSETQFVATEQVDPAVEMVAVMNACS